MIGVSPVYLPLEGPHQHLVCASMFMIQLGDDAFFQCVHNQSTAFYVDFLDRWVHVWIDRSRIGFQSIDRQDNGCFAKLSEIHAVIEIELGKWPR